MRYYMGSKLKIYLDSFYNPKSCFSNHKTECNLTQKKNEIIQNSPFDDSSFLSKSGDNLAIIM